jgi:hypothetical protein
MKVREGDKNYMQEFVPGRHNGLCKVCQEVPASDFQDEGESRCLGD